MESIRPRTIAAFLDDVSSGEPTPGGGSVAALSGSLACSLGLMVCAIGLAKGENPVLESLRVRLHPLRERFVDLVDEDAAAFAAVMVAYRLPRGAPARAAAVEAALAGAAEAPLETALRSVELLDLLLELVPLGTRQSTSDVGVAAILAKASLDGALLNVDTNLAYMKDRDLIARLASRRDDLRAGGAKRAEEVLAHVRERL
jgi:formiminotetrahydrofolate cyclodeaminase